MVEQIEQQEDRSVVARTLFNHALRRLAQREHGEEELRRKLLSCVNNPPEVEAIIAQMKQAGHLSDERFIEEYIQSRVRRGFGPIRICAELNEKGIRSEALGDALAIWQSSWISLAKRALEKKYGERIQRLKKAQNANDVDNNAKVDAEKKALILAQRRFLLYRGFESSMIQQLFSEGL